MENGSMLSNSNQKNTESGAEPETQKDAEDIPEQVARTVSSLVAALEAQAENNAISSPRSRDRERDLDALTDILSVRVAVQLGLQHKGNRLNTESSPTESVDESLRSPSRTGIPLTRTKRFVQPTPRVYQTTPVRPATSVARTPMRSRRLSTFSCQSSSQWNNMIPNGARIKIVVYRLHNDISVGWVFSHKLEIKLRIPTKRGIYVGTIFNCTISQFDKRNECYSLEDDSITILPDTDGTIKIEPNGIKIRTHVMWMLRMPTGTVWSPDFGFVDYQETAKLVMNLAYSTYIQRLDIVKQNAQSHHDILFTVADIPKESSEKLDFTDQYKEDELKVKEKLLHSSPVGYAGQRGFSDYKSESKEQQTKYKNKGMGYNSHDQAASNSVLGLLPRLQQQARQENVILIVKKCEGYPQFGEAFGLNCHSITLRTMQIDNTEDTVRVGQWCNATVKVDKQFLNGNRNSGYKVERVTSTMTGSLHTFVKGDKSGDRVHIDVNLELENAVEIPEIESYVIKSHIVLGNILMSRQFYKEACCMCDQYPKFPSMIHAQVAYRNAHKETRTRWMMAWEVVDLIAAMTPGYQLPSPEGTTKRCDSPDSEVYEPSTESEEDDDDDEDDLIPNRAFQRPCEPSGYSPNNFAPMHDQNSSRMHEPRYNNLYQNDAPSYSHNQFPAPSSTGSGMAHEQPYNKTYQDDYTPYASNQFSAETSHGPGRMQEEPCNNSFSNGHYENRPMQSYTEGASNSFYPDATNNRNIESGLVIADDENPGIITTECQDGFVAYCCSRENSSEHACFIPFNHLTNGLQVGDFFTCRAERIEHYSDKKNGCFWVAITATIQKFEFAQGKGPQVQVVKNSVIMKSSIEWNRKYPNDAATLRVYSTHVGFVRSDEMTPFSKNSCKLDMRVLLGEWENRSFPPIPCEIEYCYNKESDEYSWILIYICEQPHVELTNIMLDICSFKATEENSSKFNGTKSKESILTISDSELLAMWKSKELRQNMKSLSYDLYVKLDERYMSLSMKGPEDTCTDDSRVNETETSLPRVNRPGADYNYARNENSGSVHSDNSSNGNFSVPNHQFPSVSRTSYRHQGNSNNANLASLQNERISKLSSRFRASTMLQNQGSGTDDSRRIDFDAQSMGTAASQRSDEECRFNSSERNFESAQRYGRPGWGNKTKTSTSDVLKNKRFNNN